MIIGKNLGIALIEYLKIMGAKNMSKAELEKKENNKLSKNLTKENDKIFTDIVCYLRVSDIDEEEQEDIISDIVRMFLDWQEDRKSIESMVGEDYKKFTEDIILAVNPKKSVSKKFKEYLGIIVECFCIMFTIDFVFIYLPNVVKGNLYLNYDYTLDMLMRSLIMVTIALVVTNYIGKNSFELSKKHFSKLTNFIFGCSAALLMVILIFVSKLLNHIVIISINIRYVIGIIVVYWGYKAVEKVKNNFI